MDAVNVHNHNVHTSTGYKPCDIINNTDEDIEKRVLENIKNSIKLSNEDYDNILSGNHILINKNIHKSGKK